MKTILWLDDLRNPYTSEWRDMVPAVEGDVRVMWALDYQDFVDIITTWGLPDIISFDHDLGAEHYIAPQYWNDYYQSSRLQEKADNVEPTGYECAKWLVDYCLTQKKKMPATYVHSANPVGADSIRALLLNYRKHWEPND